jgi:hypothetical protein
VRYKRTLIVALVGLNLMLLAALLLSAYSVPAAYAQRAGGSYNYAAVTCEVDQAYDVLYLLDLSERKLHAFLPDRQIQSNMQHVGFRDLESDFRRGAP